MVMPGPYGDGGGANEREVARKYANKGMVVFLPDYYPTRNSENNFNEVMAAVGAYGPFLKDSAKAQKIAKLGYDQLAKMPIVDADKISAIGFCFGGAMALNLARSGAKLQAAVSLHGEYPDLDVKVGTNGALGKYNTKYFVEMVGAADPFIPESARAAWVNELQTRTKGTGMDYEMKIYGNTVHAFSIKYSQTFLDVLVKVFHLRGNKLAKKVGDSIPGVIQYDPDVAAASFHRINDIFADMDLFPKLEFESKASLVYKKGTKCKTKDEKHQLGFREKTQTKAIGVCTTNVIGSTAIFECDTKTGVILEHVYYDVLYKTGTKDCSGKILYTMPISNGCNDYGWGAMHMTWSGFCQAPKTSATGGLKLRADKAAIAFGPDADVIIMRTGANTLSVDASTVQVKGGISAKKIIVDGMPLEDYIRKMVSNLVKAQQKKPTN